MLKCLQWGSIPLQAAVEGASNAPTPRAKSTRVGTLNMDAGRRPAAHEISTQRVRDRSSQYHQSYTIIVYTNVVYRD